MIFYIIYFFCHQGRENLYEMMQTTFQLHTNPDGTQYVFQALDKIDKNYGVDDINMVYEGKMYPTGGN